MKHKYLKWIKQGIVVTTAFSILCSSAFVGTGKVYASGSTKDNASAAGTETASLRFVFTTDIHGMVSSMDYDAGTDYKNAGLARAYDLINTARNELPADNVYTFDIGDVLFDATTEFIMEQDAEVLQPIYEAMTYVGYDAITLGNHDFDYGKDYILSQLNSSGLIDKVVVSNLFNSKDNSYPFLQNMLIKRDVETADGSTMEVTIGVIGETIPTLSAKTQNYTGTWKTEDIVNNTEKEAANLKQQGADVVVVLAHSGFGAEQPVENAENVSYALTKLEDVDVVLCGHEHNEFPSSNKSMSYYALPGVDSETGLVNGKPVVMAKNLGKSIGVVDLTVALDKNNEVEITESKGEVRKVTSTNTKENADILACFAGWKEEFESDRNKTVATLADGEVLENYFGLLEDNDTLQMQNEAKIAFALRYIMRNKKDYASYPIIAASSYTSYGSNSSDDYVNVSGVITQGDLVPIQNYRQYTGLYKITGAQLKEWLEWTASAYEQISTVTTWTDETVSTLMKENTLSSLLSESWIDDWGLFYVFDGIEYQINPSVAPRYDKTGKKISNTNRVVSLTYNGKQISSTDVFVLASTKLSAAYAPLAWAPNQIIYSQYRTQTLMAEYLGILQKAGNISIKADNNWSLVLPYNYSFILKGTAASEAIAKTSSWYKGTLKTDGDYKYYSATYTPVQNKVKANIVISPFTVDPSKSSFDVYVEASSPNGIKKICYYPGVLKENDPGWDYMREVTDKKFTAYVNGTYSILVEDLSGNRTIETIVIDNIGIDGMAVPKVKSCNNRSSAVTGTAEPSTDIVVETNGKTFTAKVKSDGAFSCSISGQKVGDVIYVYAKDDATNRVSEKVKLVVKRAAGNQPTANAYYNNSGSLTGTTNDEDVSIIAVANELRKIYVNSEEDKTRLLESTENTMTTYTIEVVGGSIENGSFQLNLPDLDVNTVVTVYSMDVAGRLSKAVTVKVQDGGPYRPDVNSVYNVEKEITGTVSSTKASTIFTVYAVVNGNTYSAKSNKSGEFSINFDEQLKTGDVISVYAEDEVSGKTRVSATSEVKVTDMSKVEAAGTITLNNFTLKSTSLTVNFDPNEEVYVSVPTASGNEIYSGTTDEEGVFTTEISSSLISGKQVYAYARFSYGGLIDVASQMVPYAKPATPTLVTDVSNIDKTIKIVSDENSKVYLLIGDKTYTSEKGVYSDSSKGYVHTFTVSKIKSGTKIRFYAENPSLKSTVAKSTVKRVGAEILKNSSLVAGATEVTGKIAIFSSDSKKEVTVKSTGSKVYVKVNSKTYTAKISEKGSFSVTIPALKAGDKVSIWAKNAGGTGPGVSVVIGATSTSTK